MTSMDGKPYERSMITTLGGTDDKSMKTAEIVIAPMYKTPSAPVQSPVIECILNHDGALAYVIRGWLRYDLARALLFKLRSELTFKTYFVRMPGGLMPLSSKKSACGDPGLVHEFSGAMVPVDEWGVYDSKKTSANPDAKFDTGDDDLKLPGTTLVECIRQRIEHEANPPDTSRDASRKMYRFNACLINEYENGQQYIGYHSDREALGYNSAVATVSLGGSRAFTFQHKMSKRVLSVTLHNGDLCIMLGKCQELYKHSIPKVGMADYRISLTYRWLTGKA